MKELNSEQFKAVVNALRSTTIVLGVWLFSLILFFGYLLSNPLKKEKKEPEVASPGTTKPAEPKNTPNFWHAPDKANLEGDPDKDQILYGEDLIAHTSLYFGPIGKVKAKSTNGMNCQNCHLDAGTRVFGNNYAAVAATYPKYRARSGSKENIHKRVNDCFERSLNGKALDTNSKEMQAITAYIKWLGRDVEKGKKPEGSGFKDIALLDRAADPVQGKILYEEKCTVCHQKSGEGQLTPDKSTYVYPPLWGKYSYNVGAGLYRISNLAKYIRYNMPLGATHESPQMSDEEAWDIAAYINSMNRPKIDISKDWSKIAEKPFDHPFGPFVDPFNEEQHKFGPYKLIIEEKKKKENAEISITPRA